MNVFKPADSLRDLPPGLSAEEVWAVDCCVPQQYLGVGALKWSTKVLHNKSNNKQQQHNNNNTTNRTRCSTELHLLEAACWRVQPHR